VFAVCIAVLEKIDATLEAKDKKSKPKIEAAIDKFCMKKEIDPKDKKVVRTEALPCPCPTPPAIKRCSCAYLMIVCSATTST
jgi:hypothetical protein